MSLLVFIGNSRSSLTAVNSLLKITPLICEDLERAPELNIELIIRCCSSNLGRLRRRGKNSTHFVNWSTMIKTFTFPLRVRGSGHGKSRCTLPMGAVAWYLIIAAMVWRWGRLFLLKGHKCLQSYRYLASFYIKKKVLPRPGFCSFDSLVSSCRYLVAKTEYLSSQITGNNQNSFLIIPLLSLFPEDFVAFQM